MRLRGNPGLKFLDRQVLGGIIRLLCDFKGKPQIRQAPRSVLLVKLNALGDTLLFLAIARILKREFPGIRVDFLGSEINQPLLERSTRLDQVRYLRLGRVFAHPRELIARVKEIRRAGYDVVIDGSQWERITALIALFSGAGVTIGFDTPGHSNRAGAFHITVAHRRQAHEIDCFFDLLKPLGIQVREEDRFGEYFVLEEDRKQLDALDLPKPPWVVFHPGCGAHGLPRQWSAAKYAALGESLKKLHPDVAIILTGYGSEGEICARVREIAPQTVLDFSNRLCFPALAALLERASLLVSGNTGVMHLAAALKTPQAALHGPTDPQRWGPLNPNAVVVQSLKSCAPCLYLGYEYQCDCPDCMEEIGVEAVLDVCHKLLTQSRGEV
jgi:ADP-heptose:LPS heptosyltransferase